MSETELNTIQEPELSNQECWEGEEECWEGGEEHLDPKLRWAIQLDWLKNLRIKFPNARVVREFLDESSDESDGELRAEPDEEPSTKPPYEPSREPSCTGNTPENEPEVESLADVEETLMKIHEDLYAFHDFPREIWRIEARQTLSNLVVHDFVDWFEELMIARERSLFNSLCNGKIPRWSLAYNNASDEVIYIRDRLLSRVRNCLKRLAKPPKVGDIISTYTVFQSIQFKDMNCNHLISQVNRFLC